MRYYFPSTYRRLVAFFLDKFFKNILRGPVVYFIIVDYLKHDVIRIHIYHLCYVILLELLYDVFILSIWGKTPGKYLTGLAVVDRQTKVGISFSQSLLRYLVGLLHLFFGWAIYALAFFKRQRTHLADWIAGTQVVSLNHPRATPKIRWIVGLFLCISISSDSWHKAKIAMKSYSWTEHYLYYDVQQIKKIINTLEIEWDDGE